jgi:hypothetical protein
MRGPFVGEKREGGWKGYVLCCVTSFVARRKYAGHGVSRCSGVSSFLRGVLLHNQPPLQSNAAEMRFLSFVAHRESAAHEVSRKRTRVGCLIT